MRIAIARPGEVAPGWEVIAEVARRAGLDFKVERSADVFEQLVAAVPFYAGLTLGELEGHGVRWPERPQGAAITLGLGISVGFPVDPREQDPAVANGALRLGTYRPIWAAPECEISPALQYLIPGQQVLLSPQDAERLGVDDGDEVMVAQLDDSRGTQSGEAGGRAGAKREGTTLNAHAAIHSAVQTGSAFLATGIAADSANRLTEPLIEVTKL
jgi:NADH-quinone oxidoreductase subunit G